MKSPRTGLLVGLFTSCLAPPLRAEEKVQKRLEEAAVVFSEIMATPDKGIPQDLMEKANCIVIVPGLKKGAFIVGGKYGKGFLSCRHKTGRGWSAPGAIRVEGGSVGFQIGGSETDVILLVMNERGAAEDLVKQSTKAIAQRVEGVQAAFKAGKHNYDEASTT